MMRNGDHFSAQAKHFPIRTYEYLGEVDNGNFPYNIQLREEGGELIDVELEWFKQRTIRRMKTIAIISA
jgi:hypothetical protein